MRFNQLYSFFFIVVIPTLKEFIQNLPPIVIKFSIMGIVVPVVAIYMLYEDPHQETPTYKQVFMAFLTSLLFVWLGYEASVEFKIPVVLGLILSFATGLSALPIIRKVREKLPVAIESIIDSATEFFKSKFKK